MNDSLNVNVLHRLSEAFAVLQWSEEQSNLFDRFCEMLTHFTDEQQELILELTKNFLRLGQSRYFYFLKKALSQIEPKDYGGLARIYVLPLLQPSDYGRSKSSTYVAYQFQSSEITAHEVFQGKNPSVVDKPEGLPRNINQKSCKILLVDDFIGTGETAENALSYLNSEIGIAKSKMIILSIVAQQEGLARIRSLGVKAYCSIVRGKGITDTYTSPTRECYQKTMQMIEDFLNVDEMYRFGYRGSEALVSLTRTPNNTFPVFWYEPRLRNGKKFVAPFPR